MVELDAGRDWLEGNRIITTEIDEMQDVIDAWAFVANTANWTALMGDCQILRPLGKRGPQAGYWGRDYRHGGLLISGQNPRAGDSQRGFKRGDDELYRLQAEFSEEPVEAKFRALMDFQKTFMSGWDIFNAIDFPKSFGVNWDQVCYVNSLQCPTLNDKSNLTVWKKCARLFLDRQLRVIRPSAVICLGSVARDLFVNQYPEITMEWMPHPTGQYARANAALSRDRLAACRQLANAGRSTFPAYVPPQATAARSQMRKSSPPPPAAKQDAERDKTPSTTSELASWLGQCSYQEHARRFIHAMDEAFPSFNRKRCGAYYRYKDGSRVVMAVHLRQKGLLVQFRVELKDISNGKIMDYVCKPSEPSKRSDWSEFILPEQSAIAEVIAQLRKYLI